MNKLKMLCFIAGILLIPFIIGCSSGGGNGLVVPSATASQTAVITTNPTATASPIVTSSASSTVSPNPSLTASPSFSSIASPSLNPTASSSATSTASPSPSPSPTSTPFAASPEALSASLGNWHDRVELSWSSVSQATSYKIYRNITTEGVFTLIGTTTEAVFSDTTSIAETDYYYKVRALIGTTEGYLCSAVYGIRSAGIVYVSQNAGNDSNNGVVSSKAFQTINTALSFMQTGNNHTLKVSEGQYNDNIGAFNYSYSGLISLTSLEGGYSDDFASRSTDRISNVTSINLGSNNCQISRSGCPLLKIEGFLFLSSRTGSNSTVYAIQLNDAGNPGYFNFCNNTVSMEISGTGLTAVALGVDLYLWPISDVNRISNNIIYANAGSLCSAYGIAKLSGSNPSEISNIIIENNNINVVAGYTSCYGIAGVGSSSNLSYCIVKNNVISAQNNYNNSLAWAVDVYAHYYDAYIINNTLIAKSSSNGRTYNVWVKTNVPTSENQITIENNILYPINNSDAIYRVGLFVTRTSGYYPPTYLKNNLFLNSNLLDNALPPNQITSAAGINGYLVSGYSGNLVTGDVSSNIFISKDDSSLYLGNYALNASDDTAANVLNHGLPAASLPITLDVDIIGATRQDPPEIGAYEKN